MGTKGHTVSFDIRIRLSRLSSRPWRAGKDMLVQLSVPSLGPKSTEKDMHYVLISEATNQTLSTEFYI